MQESELKGVLAESLGQRYADLIRGLESQSDYSQFSRPVVEYIYQAEDFHANKIARVLRSWANRLPMAQVDRPEQTPSLPREPREALQYDALTYVFVEPLQFWNEFIDESEFSEALRKIDKSRASGYIAKWAQTIPGKHWHYALPTIASKGAATMMLSLAEKEELVRTLAYLADIDGVTLETPRTQQDFASTVATLNQYKVNTADAFDELTTDPFYYDSYLEGFKAATMNIFARW